MVRKHIDVLLSKPSDVYEPANMKLRGDLFEEWHQVKKGPLFYCIITILREKMDQHNYFDAERLASLATHVFGTLYKGEKSHFDIIRILEDMIFEVRDVQELPFLSNLMRRLADCH